MAAFIRLTISLLTTSFVGAKHSCRCNFGDTCWPNASEFSTLASGVSQPLLFPVPPESACYAGFSDSGTNCSEVTALTGDGNWRSDQPGSMQSLNFETFTFKNGTISACYLNTTLGVPCQQGSVPVAGVDARSVSDVQTAVQFANKHNLRLVIKNTGHDYLGRSSARGSFMIWTHHLKNITFDKTFVPAGGSPSFSYDAVTLEAGVQWHEAYDAAEAHGRFVVGGLSAGASVGAAGGWVQGGGHSAFSPTYGLGVDNALEFHVVTANGEYLTANAYRHSDLFWALRGGGGGTFAVVISVTYQTHAPSPLTAAFLNVTIDPTANVSSNVSSAAMKTLTSAYIRLHPTLSNAKWGGYGVHTANNLGLIYVAPNVSFEVATAMIQPLFSLAQNLTSQGLTIGVNATVPFPSFYPWYTMFFNGTGQVGTNNEIGSRLLDRSLFEEQNVQKLIDILVSLPYVMWNSVAGGFVSTVGPDAAGINPAWRTAIAHIVFGNTWPEGASSAEIEKVRANISQSIAKVEALKPGSGAYFNEAFLFEKNPQQTFFGSHYGKLKAIKQKYDPSYLFLVAEGVGSEVWDDTLTCRID